MNSNRKRKSSLTLIELTVALVLTGIILAVLWQGYRSQQHNIQKIERARRDTQKLMFCKQRMEKIFSHLSYPGYQSSLFTTEDKKETASSLSLFYHQDTDPDPLFMDRVCSLLYFDEDIHCLSLTTWSSEQQSRTEILLDRVQDVSFRFLDPKTGSWQGSWAEASDSLPSWVELRILSTGDGKSHSFLWKVKLQEGPIDYANSYPGGT